LKRHVFGFGFEIKCRIGFGFEIL